jgi:hypothetical protein
MKNTYLLMKVEQSVPKRRHIKFRRPGITQKKAHNIHLDCVQPYKHLYMKELGIWRKMMCYLKYEKIELTSFCFLGPEIITLFRTKDINESLQINL